MIQYVYAKTLCRKAVARALRGKIVGRSGNHAFPIRIKIRPQEIVPSLYICLRKRRDAHMQDDSGCNCRKHLRHTEDAYAFIVPFAQNMEVGA